MVLRSSGAEAAKTDWKKRLPGATLADRLAHQAVWEDWRQILLEVMRRSSDVVLAQQRQGLEAALANQRPETVILADLRSFEGMWPEMVRHWRLPGGVLMDHRRSEVYQRLSEGDQRRSEVYQRLPEGALVYQRLPEGVLVYQRLPEEVLMDRRLP